MDAVVEQFPEGPTPLEWAVAIDGLLDELGRCAPQRRSVVELKLYLGPTDESAASALNLSLSRKRRLTLRSAVADEHHLPVLDNPAAVKDDLKPASLTAIS